MLVCPSRRETKVDDVSVLDDVLFSFETDLPMIATCRQRSAVEQFREPDHLGPDEPALDV